MLEKYLLRPSSFYSFHIMLTDYCNSRCTYCQQFTEYNSTEVDFDALKNTIDFICRGTSQEKRQIYLEGGEPSFYSHFEEILEYFFDIGEKVVVLTNGRVPKKNYKIFAKYLKNETIKHIGLHVPIGKEPLYDIWKKEIHELCCYLLNQDIKEKIIFLGLLYSKDIPKKDILSIINYGKKYASSTKGMSFCFPHPSILGRSHINFKDRLVLSPFITKVYIYMMNHGITPILDGTIPCVLKPGLDEVGIKESTNLYKYILGERIDISEHFEIHIDTDLKANIISNLAENSYTTTKSLLNFSDYDNFLTHTNKMITSLYYKNFENFPETCKKCDFFLHGCSGDHFKLISNYHKG